MKSFMHGGSAGDLIFGLAPLVENYPSFNFYINGNASIDWRISEKIQKSLLPLLEAQPYIKKTGVNDGNGAIDLDGWRKKPFGWLNLSDMHADFLKLTHVQRGTPWLFIDNPKRIASVVIHRSPRYHTPFPWKTILERYKDIVFVGMLDEWLNFCTEFGDVPYYSTKTHLDLARVIAGADVFMGNQSCPHAIAEGLKVCKVLESMGPKGHWAWNCHWERDCCWNVENGDISALPEKIEDFKKVEYDKFLR